MPEPWPLPAFCASKERTLEIDDSSTTRDTEAMTMSAVGELLPSSDAPLAHHGATSPNVRFTGISGEEPSSIPLSTRSNVVGTPSFTTAPSSSLDNPSFKMLPVDRPRPFASIRNLASAQKLSSAKNVLRSNGDEGKDSGKVPPRSGRALFRRVRSHLDLERERGNDTGCREAPPSRAQRASDRRQGGVAFQATESSRESQMPVECSERANLRVDPTTAPPMQLASQRTNLQGTTPDASSMPLVQDLPAPKITSEAAPAQRATRHLEAAQQEQTPSQLDILAQAIATFVDSGGAKVNDVSSANGTSSPRDPDESSTMSSSVDVESGGQSHDLTA